MCTCAADAIHTLQRVYRGGNGRARAFPHRAPDYGGAMRWVDWYGDGSLYVLDVALACCALEFDAAVPAAAAPLPPLDDRAQVAVVISGTVTDRLAPAVAAIVDGCEQQAGRRPRVISFGACASSGGPYWDSYAVTKGVDQLLAVDAYVPGCPPPPEALSAVLNQLAGRVVA
jgi:NADH-quinone oxidoreductase subunit B